MKKNKRDSRHESPNKKPQSGNDEKIIFGTYQKKNGLEIVLTNRAEYPVSDIKNTVFRPLVEGVEVKALLRQGRAKILRAMGPKLSLKERIARLLNDTGLPVEFSRDVLDEADKFGSEVAKADTKNRLDLTKIPLCTIDGETAKDFDDAVYAGIKGKNIEVIVAIADVSHYVKNQSALDEEAVLRGTSVYYPGHCIPMLPEQLSNGLCSLKPNVIRLALSVSFELSPRGKILKRRIDQAVIKSAARLTYNQVQAFYDSQKLSKIPKKLQESLLLLKQASAILRKDREKRGAMDFDVIESVVALDDAGEPLSIHPEDRLFSHKMIEDLMVATNEIVAEYFEEHQIPGLFRVHEQPDQEKLDNFYKTAQAFGVLGKVGKKSGTIEPKTLQSIMASYQKSQYKDALNTLMLRCMMQARYSEQNLMHFGLASSAYSHFTSPIRRYADLIIHRQLRHVLFEKNLRKMLSERELNQIARSISDKEVRATDLERKIDRLYASTFMSSRVGEEFLATIVACTEFGFFARITEHHVEGLVHIATISRSHVNFVPEKMALVVSGSNERYMVGDQVKVKLINVNIDRGHIDFELVKENQSTEPKKKRAPCPKKKKNG